jgi:Protein of unknown function (DUF732)
MVEALAVRFHVTESVRPTAVPSSRQRHPVRSTRKNIGTVNMLRSNPPDTKVDLDMWSIAAPVLVAGSAMSLAFAAPASAAEDEYLHALQSSYVFLSPQQLLSEGEKVCNAIRGGTTSTEAISMVVKDLQVSVPAAGNIVAAAVVNLGC